MKMQSFNKAVELTRKVNASRMNKDLFVQLVRERAPFLREVSKQFNISLDDTLTEIENYIAKFG